MPCVKETSQNQADFGTPMCSRGEVSPILVKIILIEGWRGNVFPIQFNYLFNGKRLAKKVEEMLIRGT